MSVGGALWGERGANHEGVKGKGCILTAAMTSWLSLSPRKTRTSQIQSQQKERDNKNKGQNQQNRDQKKLYKEINETKSYFFEKIILIYPLQTSD
jgi:hypothetical protein